MDEYAIIPSNGTRSFFLKTLLSMAQEAWDNKTKEQRGSFCPWLGWNFHCVFHLF